MQEQLSSATSNPLFLKQKKCRAATRPVKKSPICVPAFRRALAGYQVSSRLSDAEDLLRPKPKASLRATDDYVHEFVTAVGTGGWRGLAGGLIIG
jgi:hypothetical protein